MTPEVYRARRAGVRVVCTTRSPGEAWNVARRWAAQPGRWLAERSLKDSNDGPLVEDGPPGGVRVEQSHETAVVGTYQGEPVTNRCDVYRVVVAQ
jgi:hypothetical protein